MEGKEPTTCLVNTLCDEVSRICLAIVNNLLILEWIVNLCVWHCTRVKPYINKVKLTGKYITALAYELDVVNVWTVNVNAVIVLLTHIARYEALILEWVALHYASLNSLLYLVIELLK